jgi:small subunit ribosomal protein S6
VINVKYYEIMLIIRSDIEAEEQQEVLSGLNTAIAKEGGTVSTVLDWHKRRLSYEIAKHREGQYYLVYFSGQGNIIPELEHYFKVTDAVMRYMISSVEEADFNAAVDKAAAAATAASAAAEAAITAEEPVLSEDETEGSEEAVPAAEETEEATEEVSAENESPDKKDDNSPAE